MKTPIYPAQNYFVANKVEVKDLNIKKGIPGEKKDVLAMIGFVVDNGKDVNFPADIRLVIFNSNLATVITDEYGGNPTYLVNKSAILGFIPDTTIVHQYMNYDDNIWEVMDIELCAENQGMSLDQLISSKYCKLYTDEK